MLKKKIAAVLLSVACVAAAVPSIPAFADSTKVVTLGANLSDEQKTMILKYFGLEGESNYETLTITNDDEREHLGSYIPLEQIGTRTYSCALVNPTTSGGIQVKTANLTYVTSNMIASTLSTAGVVNCEVLAAAPFAVSGTGALTGILMAYETASGETLDETKKETATQELVATTSVAESVGQAEATQIINETKIQVIEGNVVDTGDIEVIVDSVAEEEEITLSDEDRALIIELMEQIAAQEYDYEEMKETLERVEDNVETLLNESSSDSSSTSVDINIDITTDSSSSSDSSSDSTSDSASDASADSSADSSSDSTSDSSALSEDSILLNTDDSALGSDVVFDATDTSALAETESASETEAAAETEATAETEAAVETEAAQTDASSDDFGFDITVSDSYGDTTDDSGSTDTPVDSTDADAAAEEDSGVNESTDASADITVDNSETEAAGTESAETEAHTETGAVEVISTADLVLSPNTEEGSTENTAVEAGLNYLTISAGRTDLVAGSGTISLYDMEDGSLIEEIAMNDETKVTSAAITDIEELAELGWTEGMTFRIYLENALEPNSSYYILIGDDILTTEDGSAAVQPSLQADMVSWQFDTLGYGIGLTESVDGVTAGMPISGVIYMDTASAAYAVIDSVTVDGTDVTDLTTINVTNDESETLTDPAPASLSVEFNITFAQSGETEVHVSYYDSVDETVQQLIGEATYIVTVE
ncbi:MAG: DUF1002 domain-containing protein [Clostridiales bacterium]|nr:DUF1002 domain-containing protein [Clostridiales bacterium]